MTVRVEGHSFVTCCISLVVFTGIQSEKVKDRETGAPGKLIVMIAFRGTRKLTAYSSHLEREYANCNKLFRRSYCAVQCLD